MTKTCNRCMKPGGRGGFRNPSRGKCRKCEYELQQARRSGQWAPMTPRAAAPRVVTPRVVSPRVARRPLERDLDHGTRVYLVASDAHVPAHDAACTDAVAALLSDLQPDGLVLAGDFVDLEEISRYDQGSILKRGGKRLSDGFAVANAILDQWDAAAGPNCTEKDYIDGNHEERMAKWLARGDNGVFAGDDSVDLDKRLRLRERGYRHHAGEDAAVSLGHLIVTHGRWCNKYHANKHLEEFRHSVLYGHTHSPQTIYASAYGAQQVAIGIGHLADPDSPAMSYARRPNRWAQGCAVVYVHTSGDFHVTPLNFWRGQVIYGNRAYGRRRAA